MTAWRFCSAIERRIEDPTLATYGGRVRHRAFRLWEREIITEIKQLTASET